MYILFVDDIILVDKARKGQIQIGALEANLGISILLIK